MYEIARPRVLLSRCLSFDPCRYDGRIIEDDVILRIKPFLSFLPVCPEVEIGLGVPRAPVKLVKTDQLELVQPATGRRLTGEMQSFARRFLASAKPFDGVILKSRSPTCGLGDAKIFSDFKGETFSHFGNGMFVRAILEEASLIPMEDENSLRDLNRLDDFLTRVFTGFRLRKAKEKRSLKTLKNFHNTHRFLLAAYSQKQTKLLDQLAKGKNAFSIEETLALYAFHLHAALRKKPIPLSLTRSFFRAVQALEKQLTRHEKNLLNEQLNRFCQKIISLFQLRRKLHDLLEGKALPSELETLLFPYPSELLTMPWR